MVTLNSFIGDLASVCVPQMNDVIAELQKVSCTVAPGIEPHKYTFVAPISIPFDTDNLFYLNTSGISYYNSMLELTSLNMRNALYRSFAKALYNMPITQKQFSGESEFVNNVAHLMRGKNSPAIINFGIPRHIFEKLSNQQADITNKHSWKFLNAQVIDLSQNIRYNQPELMIIDLCNSPYLGLDFIYFQNVCDTIDLPSDTCRLLSYKKENLSRMINGEEIYDPHISIYNNTYFNTRLDATKNVLCLN